ncbi:hypothetical protein ACWD4V_00720 [Streptomyces tsukubensis]
MTPHLPRIQIHVLTPSEDDEVALTDVGVVRTENEVQLFLSAQSFDSAVRQISTALPDFPLEQIERLVRTHCTEFKDFDELLTPVVAAPPVTSPPPVEPQRQERRRSVYARKGFVGAVALALVSGWALGFATHHAKAARSTAASATKPESVSAVPFTAPGFKGFSAAGGIDCNVIGNLEAECTDADGMVMATKAAIGSDSTVFTFSYGAERLGLRVFHDAKYAETWMQQAGSRELYPNSTRSGRYVLWGTDEERLKEYLGLLASAAKPESAAKERAQPLPPRLAALTLGTLGVAPGDMKKILSLKERSPTAHVLAARELFGVPHRAPRTMGYREIDIVALAAEIEPPVREPSREPDPAALVPGPAVSVPWPGGLPEPLPIVAPEAPMVEPPSSGADPGDAGAQLMPVTLPGDPVAPSGEAQVPSLVPPVEEELALTQETGEATAGGPVLGDGTIGGDGAQVAAATPWAGPGSLTRESPAPRGD